MLSHYGIIEKVGPLQDILDKVLDPDFIFCAHGKNLSLSMSSVSRYTTLFKTVFLIVYTLPY